jgi:lipopolysaccharide biosynthesis glycosyltransferase
MLHVSCAADARYVPHSAAMLHSVLTHSGENGVTVHFLRGHGVTAEDARRLAGMVTAHGGEISFLDLPEQKVAGLPTMDEIGSAMWYRLFLTELLPDVARVLYLDVDTIVLDTLGPLWETDLEGCHVAAVTNVFQEDHIPLPARLGLEPRDYFNSGVLLMNLDLMRRDGCTATLVEYARANAARLIWPDQDALNAVLGPTRRRLAPRWNCMTSVLRFPWAAYVFSAEELEAARRRPAIRHFEGPSVNKPWHLLCDGDQREDYFEHRRATPWPNVQREGVTPVNLLRRAWLPVRWWLRRRRR